MAPARLSTTSAGITTASRHRWEALARIFPWGYALAYAAVALAIHLTWFRIGDIGVESDFYAEIGPAARALAAGHFSVADFPYKGPVTAFLVAALHAVTGPLGADWYRTAVILNVLCATGSLLLIYQLLRGLYPRAVAALAMVSVSLTFEFFLHAHKASSDLLFLLLFYASVALLLGGPDVRARARGEDKGRHEQEGPLRPSGRGLLAGLAAGLLGGLAYLTRYNGLVLPVAAAVMLLAVAPRRRLVRVRLAVLAVYLAGFVAVAAPWYLVNLSQSGRALATHNLQNIFVEEFYPGDAARSLPDGGATSLPRLILHDPLRFLGHYLRNLPVHLWRDLRYTLNWGLSLLFLLGLGRLLLWRRPDRRQLAFLVFPLSYFLAMGLVYHQPRFSFPLLPAYAALAWTALLGSGQAGRRGSGLWPALPLRGLVVVILAAGIFVWQALDARDVTRWYHARQPVFVLELAPTLHRLAGSDDAILMARKPHAAFYAGLRYQPYPKEVASPQELLTFARDHGVDLILYSGIEQDQFPRAPWLAALDRLPGVRLVHADEYCRVFALSGGGTGPTG
jgi:4-amino-4-deoxy-L-arabinose transferase-like glycosyltransferase